MSKEAPGSEHYLFTPTLNPYGIFFCLIVFLPLCWYSYLATVEGTQEIDSVVLLCETEGQEHFRFEHSNTQVTGWADKGPCFKVEKIAQGLKAQIEVSWFGDYTRPINCQWWPSGRPRAAEKFVTPYVLIFPDESWSPEVPQ